MRKDILSRSAVLAIVLIFSSCAPPVQSTPDGTTTTTVPDPSVLGHITTATVLDPTIVYTVDGTVNVSAKLTIPAGTVLKFTSYSNYGSELIVTEAGQIIAPGTAEKPVVFTSAKAGTASTPAAGDWGRVMVNGSHATFTHCAFMYAGNGGDVAALVLNGSNAVVSGCTFTGNVRALDASGAKEGTVISGNLFYGNTGGSEGLWPVYINTNVDFDNTNYFQNNDASIKNTKQGIVFSGGVTVPLTFASTRVPYIIEGVPVVGALLTVNPGVTVKFTKYSNYGSGFSVSVAGRIIADGISAVTPIIFTSVKDGSDMTPARGDWGGIDIASNCVFNFCTFAYSGNGDCAALNAGATTDTTVTDCRFTHGVCGIDRSAVSGGTFAGNSFVDNISDETIP